MKNMQKKTIFITCAVTAILLLIAYCLWRQSVPESEIYEYVHPVKRDIIRKTRIHGEIGSRHQVTVFPQSNGVLKSILVKNGDRVRKGQRLAVLDLSPQMDMTAEYSTSEQSARISLEQAQRDEQRAKDLLAKGAISAKDYEKAETALAMAEKALALASSRIRTNNETLVINAPIDGVVSNLQLVENASISAQTPFCCIYNPDEMIFIGRADETDVDAFREGMNMVIMPGANKTARIPARLNYISDKGEDVNGVTCFEIWSDILADSIMHLRIGYSANAELEVERRDKVPSVEEAFVYYDPQPFVWVLTSKPEDEKHQKWEQLHVTTGISDGINIEITSNIPQGTIIRGRKK